MSKKITQPAESEDFSITMSTEAGYSAEITVKYPKDQAMIGVLALREAASDKYMMSLLHGMRDEPSIAKHLADAGLDFDDDLEDK